MQRHFLIYDTALDTFHRVRLLVFLHPVDRLYQHAIISVNTQDRTLTALVLATDDDNLIALVYTFHRSDSLKFRLTALRAQAR